MRIEFCAIDLKGLHTRRVARPDLNAIVEALLWRIAKPHPQALFCELLVAEIICQTEDPRHVTAAYFGRRFANLAIERRVLFDDEHTRSRMFPRDHQRRGRTGKCATDDHDIVIKIHGRQRGWTLPTPNAIVFP